MDVTAAGSVLTRLYNRDQLSRTRIELSADATEVGAGSFILPDPDDDDAIPGGRQFRVDEGATLISDGFIGVQIRDRGPDPIPPAVEGTYTIYDANALLHGKRMVTWNRPAETDRARILARAAIDLPGVDTSMVLATNTVTMEAKSYTTVGWDELIRDVFEYTGKTVFLHDLADGSGRCLHSHKETEGHSCGLEIVDSAAVADGVTKFLARRSPDRNRSSQGLVNDILARDQSGRTAFADDAGSITAHDADGLSHQDIVDFRATSQADLQAKADAYVVETADEVDIYSCVIGPLDEDALALIRVGDRIDVDSQTLDFIGTIRIAHMSLTPRVVDGLVKWDADLELGEAIRLRRHVTSGGIPPTPGVVIIDGRAIAGEDLGTEHWGNRDYAEGLARFDDWVGPTSYNPAPPNVYCERDYDLSDDTTYRSRTFVRHAAPAGARYARLRTNVWVVMGASDDEPAEMRPTVYRGNSLIPWTTSDPAAFDDVITQPAWRRILTTTTTQTNMGLLEVVIPVVDGHVQFAFADTYMPDVPPPNDSTWSAYFIAIGDTYSGGSVDKYDLTFYGLPASGATTIGGRVLPTDIATGDGSETIFTTPYPYEPGSLVVYVEGIRQVVTESNPATGEFTLAYAPPTGYNIAAEFVIADTEPTGVPTTPPTRELGPVPGADIADVAGTEAAGTSREYASEDHVHRGVHKITADSGDVYGDVNLVEGTNVTIARSGQDITFNASGGGGSGGWDAVTGGTALQAGRTEIWDQNLEARLVLDGYANLSSVGAGNNVELTPDTSTVVDITAGDGLVLPPLTSDPTAFRDGQLYYDTASDIVRLRAQGIWTPQWTTIAKSADESKNSTSAVADDSELVVVLAASTNYALRLNVFFLTNSTADLKYRLVFTGTTTRVRRRVRRTATDDVAQTIELKTTFDGSDVVLSTTGSNPWLEEEVILQVGGSGGSFKLQWSQVTSNAGPTTCLEGSHVRWITT